MGRSAPDRLVFAATCSRLCQKQPRAGRDEAEGAHTWHFAHSLTAMEAPMYPGSNTPRPRFRL
eukprot:2997404-Rhodomonas_salina.1